MDPADVKFDHYFTYDEMESFLKAITSKYPDLPAVFGRQSGEGRDNWVVTFRQADRQPDEKPALT